MGVLDPFVTQERALRLVPERGIGQTDILRQPAVLGDKGIDAGRIGFQAELFEQGAEVFVGQFHEILLGLGQWAGRRERGP